MTPYKIPPREYCFIKGRSGNPLGRPCRKRDTELTNDLIKLFALIISVYGNKKTATEKWLKIRSVLNEK